MGIFRKSRRRIRQEAADWAARLGAGADENMQADFRRWHEADRRNAEAYDRMAAIWSNSGRLSPARPAPSAAERTNGLAQRRLRFALAASIVAAVALLAVLALSGNWSPGSRPGAKPLFASAVGEIREIELPDGSRLILDSDSRVELSFSASERRLALQQGRARFTVAHESRPFIVAADSSEVVATGTVFDVSLWDNRLAVVLIEGSVEIRRPSAPDQRPARHRLQAGQRLSIAGSAPVVRQPASRGETLWPARMLEFDEARLEEAAALVNRYGGGQLSLGSDRIRNLRISGAYRAGDVDGFARSLAAAFGLRLEAQPDGSLLLTEPDPAAR